MARASEKADSKKLLFAFSSMRPFRPRESQPADPRGRKFSPPCAHQDSRYGRGPGPPPAFVAILTGFSAHVRQGLRPGKVAKTLRHSSGFDEMMADIDEEFEGQGKPVLHQPGRDEDAICAIKLNIAVTHGAIAQIDGVPGRHHGLLSFTDGERHEIIGMPGKCRGDCVRHCLHDRLEFLGGDVRIGKDRVTQAVFGLTHGRLLGHERCR